MAYCLLANLVSVLSEAEIARLTDDTAGKIIDENIVGESISSGDELIDGYLRSRYSLPLTNTPKLITNIAVNLAIYFLYLRRFRTKMPESVDNQYKSQIKLLEQIQKGFITLGIEEISTETSQAGNSRVNKVSSDRVFTKEFLNKF